MRPTAIAPACLLCFHSQATKCCGQIVRNQFCQKTTLFHFDSSGKVSNFCLFNLQEAKKQLKTFPDKDLPCSPRPGPPTGRIAPPRHPPTFEASDNPDGAPAWWSEPHHVVLEARLLSRLHSAAALQQVHASVLSPIHSDPPNPKHNGHRQGLLRCHRRRRPPRQGHHGGECPSSR